MVFGRDDNGWQSSERRVCFSFASKLTWSFLNDFLINYPIKMAVYFIISYLSPPITVYRANVSGYWCLPIFSGYKYNIYFKHRPGHVSVLKRSWKPPHIYKIFFLQSHNPANRIENLRQCYCLIWLCSKYSNMN